MNEDLLDELKQCRDVGEIVNLVTNASLEYSGIQRWTFVRDAERRALRFFLELCDRAQHPKLARTLGGTVQGNEICFEVPLHAGFLAPDTPQPPLLRDSGGQSAKGPPVSRR
jgi:hypothetical protein